MEENKLKSVWVLTYKGSETDREIFGVYTNEDAACDALNDELLLPGFLEYKKQEEQQKFSQEPLSDDEIYDLLFDEYDPQVIMCKINY